MSWSTNGKKEDEDFKVPNGGAAAEEEETMTQAQQAIEKKKKKKKGRKDERKSKETTNNNKSKGGGGGGGGDTPQKKYIIYGPEPEPNEGDRDEARGDDREEDEDDENHVSDGDFSSLQLESTATSRARKELTRIYKKYCTEKTVKIELLLSKCEGNEEKLEMLLLAVRRKYLPDDETRTLVLKRFNKSRYAFQYARDALAPIWGTLVHSANGIHGTVIFRSVRNGKSLDLVVQVPAKLDTSEMSHAGITISKMRILIHNRHQIGDKRARIGHLLASPDLPEHERRKLEKYRDQRRDSRRDKKDNKYA